MASYIANQDKLYPACRYLCYPNLLLKAFYLFEGMQPRTSEAEL